MAEKFIDMDSMFDSIFNKLSSPEFGENLVGELPLYIQPFPPEHQGLIDEGVSRLIKRLERKGLSSVSINLYTFCMEILEEEGIFETILEDEKSIPRDDIMSTLDSVLDVNATIIPRIQERIEEANPDSFLLPASVAFILFLERMRYSTILTVSPRTANSLCSSPANMINGN